MMNTDDGRQPEWTQPGWLAEVNAWTTETLARHRITVSGPIEQPHLRPWSTVLTVPTSDGLFYFKATTPTFGHEPALTQALHRWRPDCTPDVLAIDASRGWLLMRTSGVAVRTMLHGPQDLYHWERVLPLYAELQIELVERRHELLAMGTPDRRLNVLPARFEELLSDGKALRVGLPDGLSAEEARRLRGLAPAIAARCEQLAGAGIPESLHHDDFHDGNVFYSDGRYILADWAECAVAHPFFSLLIAPRAVAYRVNLPDDDPAIARLIDGYFEAWEPFAPREALREIAFLAQPLGALCRALTWHNVTSRMAAPECDEYGEAVPRWLRELLTMIGQSEH